MSSPLVRRVPSRLAEYRRRGVRYVVTNSDAREQYRRNALKRSGFPSFVRFYRELEACPRVASFDPATWGGKGPLVWVYDLGRSCPPPSGEEPVAPGAAPARPSVE
jgi:hypothetical protein